MKKLNSRVAPEEEMFLKLSRAYQLSRKWAERILSPLGITLAEYNLLRIV